MAKPYDDTAPRPWEAEARPQSAKPYFLQHDQAVSKRELAIRQSPEEAKGLIKELSKRLRAELGEMLITHLLQHGRLEIETQGIDVQTHGLMAALVVGLCIQVTPLSRRSY